MDKYEYQVHADEIKKLISEHRYAEAMNIADSIDWRKVRSVSMLQTVSEIYKVNKKYDEAREILLLAYDRYPSRNIVYALCELAIKLNDVVQAKLLYEEFVSLAPNDTSSYVLKYKLYEALDVSVEERIELLEEFKRKDYTERWAYELALLYHKIGQETKCVETCDELILWFGEGKYVKKAMELKMKHTRLSKEQQLKYEGKQEPVPVTDKFMSVNPAYSQQLYDTDPQSGRLQQIPMTPYSQDFQQGYGTTTGPMGMAATMQQGQSVDMNTPMPGQSQEMYMFDQGQPADVNTPIPSQMQMSSDPVRTDAQHTAQMLTTSEIDRIEIKPVNVGIYNTMDLQNALSQNISKIFESESASYPVSGDYADSELYDGANEGSDIELSESNGPVISLKSVNPADNELDEVPGSEEDVQITSFIPAYGTADTEDDSTGYKASGNMSDAEETAEQNGYIKTDEADYDKGYDTEAKEEESADKAEPDTVGYEDSDTESYADDEFDDAPDDEEDSDDEAEDDPDDEIDDDLDDDLDDDPDDEMDDETDPELKSVYKGWENKKKENEERRIQEAKVLSLQQTADIMAQLKGVLPEIGDIAKPTPPRGVAAAAPEPYFTIPEKPERQEIDFAKKNDGEEGYPETEELPETEEKEIEYPEIKELTEAEEKEEEYPETKELPEEEQKDEEYPETKELSEEEEEEYPETDELPEIETEDDDYPDEDQDEEPDIDFSKEASEQPDEDNKADDTAEKHEAPKDEIYEPEAEDDSRAEEEARGKTEEMPFKEVTYEPETDPIDITNLHSSGDDKKNPDANNELYFREIMNIEEPDDEEIPAQAGDSKEGEDALTWSEDEETARRAAFEVTSELPEYPYEELDDYGEVEEMVMIEQPESLDGIMKTGELPIDAIAQANYEAGMESEDDGIEERRIRNAKSQKPTGTKRPGYMKLDATHGSKREFDEGERLVFGRFQEIEWLKSQIVEALDTAGMDSARGNVIVMGNEAGGRKAIAVDIIKVMRTTEVKFKGKVAKISGEALNKKDIPLTIKKLSLGALIVENAHDLTPSSARLLAEALELGSAPVLVILEGDKKKLTEILNYSKDIMSRVFNARVDLQDFSTDDLVAYGKNYAGELEYAIDEMGVLALYRRIGDLQTLDHTVTLDEVCDIIDNAIRHVDKKNMSHFMDVLLAKRYDDNDYIILREKDFIQ